MDMSFFVFLLLHEVKGAINFGTLCTLPVCYLASDTDRWVRSLPVTEGSSVELGSSGSAGAGSAPMRRPAELGTNRLRTTGRSREAANGPATACIPPTPSIAANLRGRR